MPVYAPHKMRYTLTYNEGTKDYKPNHIAVVDIPSHIMREPRQFCIIDTLARYTLTYSEGTYLYGQEINPESIYPHI